MNIKRTALYSALLATAFIGAPALAQEAGGNDANGSSTTILPNQAKPGTNAAQQAAPGQQQKTGQASSAQEVAPGQQQKQGTSTAQQAAPGQQQNCAAGQSGENCAQGDMTGQATGTEQPKQQTGEATTTKQQKTGQAETTTKQQQAGETTQKSGGSSSTTAGASGTSNETTASINVTTEQKTEIRQVLTETRVEPAKVDFDVTVGVAVPKTVVLHPLPARVVKLVPAYEGYEYFVLADGRIIIVEPGTLTVVYILTA